MPDTTQATLGFGQSSLSIPQAPAPEFDALAEREKRKSESSLWDTYKSAFRQNSLVAGAVADSYGDYGMKPDPTYNPFNDPKLPELSKGIPEEFLPYLWKSHSAAHAIYTADRLREKVKDQQRIDDLQLGFMGNLGLGLVSAPDTIVLDALGVGLVSNGMQAVRAYRATSAIGRAASEAEATAARMATRSSTSGVLQGAAVGGVENAAIEKLRQSYNFENSDEAAFTAGVMGFIPGAIFGAAGARSASRVVSAADREASAMRALADAHEGKALTPEQVQTINEVHAQIKAVDAIESGKITEGQYVDQILKELKKSPTERAIDPEHMGPPEPDAHFLDRLQERTRGQAQEIIDRFHMDASENSRLIAHQSKQFVADWQGRLKADRERLQEQARQAAQEGPTLADLQTPKDAPKADTALGAALKKAFDKSGLDLGTKLTQQERAANRTDITEQAAARKKAKEDAWALADAHAEAHKAKQTEAAYIHRELIAAELEDPHGVHAKPETAVAPQAAPDIPSERDTAHAMVGQEVTFADAEGRVLSGKVSKVNDFNGLTKLVIKDEEGNMRSLFPHDIDQWPLKQPPEGFLHNTVGAAQALPLQHMAEVSQYASRWTGYTTVPGTNGKVKVPLRFDLYAHLNASENSVIRKLGNAMLRDPVGFKDKGTAQDMTAGEWRDQIRRTIAGEYHLAARDAVDEARKATKTPFWDKLGFNARFYEAAAILARGDTDVLQQWPQAAHGALQKAAAAQQKAYSTMLSKIKDAGVQGAELINPNNNYVNRVWRHDKIRQAIALHGEANVHQLLAQSFYGMTAKGPLTGDVAKAKSFLNVIRKLEFGTELQDVHLAARDMHTLRAELEQAGLSKAEVDTMVDVMFEARHAEESQAGKPGNLKARMAIDETAKVQTPAGTLSLHDLLENDSRILVDRYITTMGGHYGMARVGITSAADFRALIREAEEEHMAKNHGDRFKGELQWVKDAYAHTVGRPMSMADYSGTARLAAAARGYTRAATLGQLGISAAFELKQAVGVMGMKAFTAQLPTFRGFLSALRSGFIPDPGLARQIQQISGHGAEMAAAYARSREISEDLPAHILGGAEHWANRVSHAADVVSGNASITSFTRQLSAKMSIQFLHDLGESATRMTDKVRNRLAGHGLEGKWADDVVSDLRTYADTKDGVVLQLRLQDWLRDAPDTYEAFQTFVGRQVRDVIQDHDLGETMPFMHSTLGKMFGELKTFFLVAHAKNMLKNMNYADGTSMGVLMYGMLGEALGYSVQQAINNPHELDKRLDPHVMGMSVMARMSSLGFLPMIYGTGYQLATGQDAFMPGSTSSGTNNRSFLMTPTFQTVGALTNLPGHLTQATLGTSPYTGKEFKSDMRGVPFMNTYGARGLVNYMANAMPDSNAE